MDKLQQAATAFAELMNNQSRKIDAEDNIRYFVEELCKIPELKTEMLIQLTDMDDFDYPAIGQRIKMFRKRKGLNQTELAQQLNKSLRTVQKYETGEIEVSITIVNQIADILETKLSYILGYESSTSEIKNHNNDIS